MTSPARVYPGQKVVTYTGKAFCRVGLIVLDKDGQLYGLSARHILECESDSRLFDAESGGLVGRRAQEKICREHKQSFFSTIGAFKIENQDLLNNIGTLQRIGTALTFAEVVVGCRVFKIDQSVPRRTATVSGVGGSINFRDPYTDTVTVFRDIIEIMFEPEFSDAVANREAGSLIVTEDQHALGLIIAGESSCCYVAPLLPYLEQHGLRLPTNEPIIHINDPTSELRQVIWGAQQMREELLADSLMVADPVAEAIPQRLLDLVE